jgi:hypothetical protein
MRERAPHAGQVISMEETEQSAVGTLGRFSGQERPSQAGPNDESGAEPENDESPAERGFRAVDGGAVTIVASG